MCSEKELAIITNEISGLSKAVFGKQLHSVVLYGSYARGEQDEESDIDIMVLVELPAEKLKNHKKAFIRISSALGLEYDVLVCVTLKDCDTFFKYCSVVPFYKNVMKDGINIA